jgi:phage I-like protein
MSLASGTEIQLMPAGQFHAFDGRPHNAPSWRLDAALAQNLIAAATARPNPYVIDYEHQTLHAKTNGQPAPAAGWFHKLEWREGSGLYAVDVEWTASAKAMIAGGEYKFISPVIAYDKSGAVTGLLMAAVTNNPAIGGMDEVLLAAASLQFTHNAALTLESSTMNELLEQLIWLLNLPVGSTAADVSAQLGKLQTTIQNGQDSQAAASCDLIALVTDQRTTIASLTASIATASATPDPAKYVDIATVTTLRDQVTALTNEINTGRVNDAIGTALKDGRLLPSMEGWAREFGGKDVAALTSYLSNAPKLAALTGMQTAGVVAPGAASTLTESQIALCTAMGVAQDDFLKTLNAEKA